MPLSKTASAGLAVLVALAAGLTAAPASASPAGLTAPSAASAARRAEAAGSRGSVDWPNVSGAYGQTPHLTFPRSAPPSKLEVKVLHQGRGPRTRRGELLVANYLGQIWGGKVFDSSFARHQLSGFEIGVGAVIKGWDDSLVGVRTGSRLLLVIPPADGYGPSGNKAAGITGKDTLVFVVDVVAAYGADARISPKAKLLTRSSGGVTVSGPIGAAPKISVRKGSRLPSSAKVTVLARGDGPPVRAGLVVVQFEAATSAGVLAESTWAAGSPYALNPGQAGEAAWVDSFEGIPLGSRVLVRLPASSGAATIFVIDLVAQPRDPQR